MNRNEEYFELMNELEEAAPDLADSIRKAKKRRNRVSFVYRPLAGLAACFALFVLLVNFSAPVAQACANVPFLRELANAVTFSRSLSYAVENGYVQKPELVQQSNGITARIEYVIVDQKQVNVFYRLESEAHRSMYAVPEALRRDGSGREPCSWTTPINGTDLDTLWQITLDYHDEEVPEGIMLVIHAHDDSREEDSEIARFTFLLEFESEKIAEGIVYPVNQTVILDGQSITITDIEVYPTHLRVNTVDGENNTAWLRTLDFYIETEKGRFDIPADGIIATGTGEGRNSFRADSLYFYDAEKIELVITGVRWLSKDMQRIRLDLTTGKTDGLPEGVTLAPADAENRPFMLHVQWDRNENQHILLGMDYYDAEGNQRHAPVCCRDCREHEGNCWYEWLDLKDYSHDQIWICPTYSHGWEAVEPIVITVK